MIASEWLLSGDTMKAKVMALEHTLPIGYVLSFITFQPAEIAVAVATVPGPVQLVHLDNVDRVLAAVVQDDDADGLDGRRRFLAGVAR